MKTIGSIIGGISFVFLGVGLGAESELPFWQHAFFLFLFLIIGTVFLFFSLRLIKKAEEKKE